MEITWNISQLDRRASDGFVHTAHWQANAVDGDHTAFAYGTCAWTEGEPEIPYDDLTKEQVLEWVWLKVDRGVTEATLATQLHLIKNPLEISGVPWPTETPAVEDALVEGDPFNNESQEN